ncbi:putative polypeptide N-acetylgalactosaminyltransferase 9, partial [Stegodyphus mimosarum]
MMPRRRKLIIKGLLIVPAMWMVVTYIFAATSNHSAGEEKPSEPKHKAERSLQQQQPVHPNVLLVEPSNNVQARNKDPEYHVEQGQGVLLPPREPDGAGELGKPVKLSNLTEEQQILVKRGWKNNAFNQYVSDMISLHRSLPDPRDKECRDLKYPSDLPPTSVIICFHNEAWSVLLRTVHSVLERSPEHLIKEIILVDDYSDLPHLKKRLENYLAQLPKVQLVRAQKREGLIRARLLGASVASGPVLTYLDSHCECTEGWLEPLLYRIYQNTTNVVCPVIDVISDDTFQYHYRDSRSLNVGGFDWNLQFNWHPVPERENKKRKHTWMPVA